MATITNAYTLHTVHTVHQYTKYTLHTVYTEYTQYIGVLTITRNTQYTKPCLVYHSGGQAGAMLCDQRSVVSYSNQETAGG